MYVRKHVKLIYVLTIYINPHKSTVKNLALKVMNVINVILYVTFTCADKTFNVRVNYRFKRGKINDVTISLGD